MTNAGVSPDAARIIVTTVLGRDPGPMAEALTDSHHVYVGADVVTKPVDADRHTRLDRELSLSTELPVGLTPSVLASGPYQLEHRDVRFACYGRVRGTSPGMGMPDVDATPARLLVEQGVHRLQEPHR